MYRQKMLEYDLKVVNRDLRPLSFAEGLRMQARDQYLQNLAIDTGRKLQLPGPSNAGKKLSEENRKLHQRSVEILKPLIKSAAMAKELHQEIDLWDCHKRSYRGLVGHIQDQPQENKSWKLMEIYIECSDFDTFLNWGTDSNLVNRHTSANVAKCLKASNEVQDIVEEVNLYDVRYTRDFGPNIKSALGDAGIDCFCHV